MIPLVFLGQMISSSTKLFFSPLFSLSSPFLFLFSFRSPLLSILQIQQKKTLVEVVGHEAITPTIIISSGVITSARH